MRVSAQLCTSGASVHHTKPPQTEADKTSASRCLAQPTPGTLTLILPAVDASKTLASLQLGTIPLDSLGRKLPRRQRICYCVSQQQLSDFQGGSFKLRLALSQCSRSLSLTKRIPFFRTSSDPLKLNRVLTGAR